MINKFSSGIILTSLANNKSRIYFSLKVIIALLLVAYLISFSEVEKILQSFQQLNLSLFALSLILLFPNILLQYWKWKLTCNKLLGETKRRRIIFSLFYGFPAAVFTPGRSGEYFGRGLAFKHRHFSEIIIATAVDKFFTIIVTFIAGSVGMIIFIYEYYEVGLYVPLPLIISFFLFAAFGLGYLFSRKEWIFNNAESIFKYEWLKKIFYKLKILKRLDTDFSLKMLFISALFLLCYLLQFAILLAAFTHSENFSKYFLASLIIMFAKSILAPITFSELGVREGAAVFFLSQMGESSISALNASLLLFAVNILIPSLIGIVLLFIRTDD